MKEMALVHCERNGNDKKNNLMMSRRKKQMRERKKGVKMRKRNGDSSQCETEIIGAKTTGSDQNTCVQALLQLQ